MSAADHLNPEQFKQLSFDFGASERKPKFQSQLVHTRSARMQKTWRRVDSANARGTGWSIYAPSSHGS